MHKESIKWKLYVAVFIIVRLFSLNLRGSDSVTLEAMEGA